MNSFYNKQELMKIGFKSFGKNILISRYARFYSPHKMNIGNNVRIDDFCILSGKITIGDFVHVSAFNALYGRYGIEIENYSGLSPRCSIYSASDDFSGDFLVGPLVKEEYRNVTGGKVIIKKYSQVGSGCVVLPNITINEGVAVGAMSLINKNLDEWKVFAGVPAKFIKERSKRLLNYL